MGQIEEFGITIRLDLLVFRIPDHVGFNSYRFIEELKRDGIELENIKWRMCG